MKTDSELKNDVLSELLWDPLVSETKVGVSVKDGEVTLTGELDWNFQRRAVERMVRPLKGLVGITDNIQLKSLPIPLKLRDRIQDALTRQAMREARRIEVSVVGSEVTLSGHVHSWAERNAAEGATWSAPGVSRVNNQLAVEA